MKHTLRAGLSALALIASPALAETSVSAPPAPAAAAPAPASATAEIKDAAGAVIGQARLTATPGGVLIRIEVAGLTPGWHGLHIHAKGDCTGPAFTSAGAHAKMAGMEGAHGLRNAMPEAGDLPNLFIGADGRGGAEIFTPFTRLADLLDADGSALVIHAAPDDQITAPIGGAGARVACGVLAAA